MGVFVGLIIKYINTVKRVATRTWILSGMENLGNAAGGEREREGGGRGGRLFLNQREQEDRYTMHGCSDRPKL